MLRKRLATIALSTTVILGGTACLPTPPGTTASGWAALRKCESHGNYQARNKSGKYTGAYQFDKKTWASVGGTGIAGDAPAAEQDMRAYRLYMDRGSSPWPHCGRHL